MCCGWLKKNKVARQKRRAGIEQQCARLPDWVLEAEYRKGEMQEIVRDGAIRIEEQREVERLIQWNSRVMLD